MKIEKVWESVAQAFLTGKPIPVMLRGLLEHAFPDEFFDAFFKKTAQLQHQKELAFSTITKILFAVVLRVRPSVHAAALDEPSLTVSLTSLYEKLQRVEPSLCEKLISVSADKLHDIFLHLPNSTRPDPIPGLRLRTIDGNYLAGTDHRLKVHACLAAACLPGMTLALREDRTGLISHLLCREDAYTGERSLTTDILSWVCSDDLFLGDRNFCYLDLIKGIANKNAFFLFRHHAGLHLNHSSELTYIGKTDTGEVYEGEVRLGQGEDGPKCRCIVVRLYQPSENGDREIVLLSNVPKDKANAVTLAEIYRRRWKIEHSFQEMTDYLRCEVKTLAYPKASLFGFTLAVLAYDILAVLKGALASIHGVEKVENELSSYAMAEQVASVTEGMKVALPPEYWKHFGKMTPREMADWLLEAARNVNWKRFQKAKGTSKKKKKKVVNTGSPHVSTARLLNNKAKK